MRRQAGVQADVDLGRLRAHWVRAGLLAIPPTALPPGEILADLRFSLEHAASGGLAVTDEPSPGAVPLEVDVAGLPGEVRALVPHLAGCIALRLREADAAHARVLVREQLALVVRDATDRVRMATGVQLPHVLDDLYAASATARAYGAVWSGQGPVRRPTLTVWAPTARRLSLVLWPEGGPLPAGEPELVPMDRQEDGAWTVTGEPGWRDRCYQLEVEVVLPRSGSVHTGRTTDPWAVGLTVGSTHAVMVDLDDQRWAPEVWAEAPAPPGIRPVDQTIYELHVRDFSREDESLPAEVRGSYLGFVVDGPHRRHLAALAEAGLNTVHLLPCFDLSTVPEDPAVRRAADPTRLAAAGPASAEQQRLVAEHAMDDAFNWGYDPWHFLVPEGSYATDAASAHGGARVAQCRAMVGGLHRLGLRVVLDQVYNHTTDAGLSRASVLDRVVPGYYHRLNADGYVEQSTCCQNVATEHAMAEKLMVDGCVLWVRRYRVDGFRFDLMGHHSRANLEAVRAALDGLTLERDGVDGRAVTLYGEGWNFGEVANNARFYQATQGQLDGTGIGTFNDRLRDAVRGGSVHGSDPRRGKGFATGGQDPRLVDTLQVGLAGGLRDLELVSQATGRPTVGGAVPYGWGAAGYASSPEEVVNYVDAHDNETLWDTLTLKLPRRTPMAERIRRNTLALATVTLSQGISFWHAGAELLRSKSLDRNSYDSGDWFNRYDPQLRDNGFGRGLPPAADNGSRWKVLAPLLADPRLRPTPEDLATARDAALDLLRLRAAHPLLRLGDAGLIRRKVSFPVSGTPQGRDDLVVMLVDDEVGPRADRSCSGLLLVLNASVDPARVVVPVLARGAWTLSPVQQQGADPVVRGTRVDPGRGSVEVPGLTAAVLTRAG